jgi:hypothetical protein
MLLGDQEHVEKRSEGAANFREQKVDGVEVSTRSARFSSSSSHNMAPIVMRSHFLVSVFGLTGKSKRNLINVLK